ncbi:MAG: SDR family oxidoreductase [Saccharofermentans sp.]|nr:SDR family oxidoreductase [Saccharofermentans sp.]
MHLINLSGKNILVVGASSGIGEETAWVLARQGANVILLARREERLADICSRIGEKASYYLCDVSDIDSIAAVVKTVVDEKGKLDGMAYIAGISDGDVPVKYLTYERQLNTFKTNYFAFVEFVRQVTKRGVYNEGMRIVAVSSIASLRGEKAHVAYSASKSAMDSAIRCIAKELGSKGICINSVAPAMVNTEMYQHFLDVQGEESEANLRAVGRQYLGLAETSDVANAIAFLISPDARFITGITLPVDGGFTTT